MYLHDAGGHITYKLTHEHCFLGSLRIRMMQIPNSHLLAAMVPSTVNNTSDGLEAGILLTSIYHSQDANSAMCQGASGKVQA